MTLKKSMIFRLEFQKHTWLVNQFPLLPYFLPFSFSFYFLNVSFRLKSSVHFHGWVDASFYGTSSLFFCFGMWFVSSGYLLLVTWQVCWSIWVKLSEYQTFFLINLWVFYENFPKYFLKSFLSRKDSKIIHNEDL